MISKSSSSCSIFGICVIRITQILWNLKNSNQEKNLEVYIEEFRMFVEEFRMFVEENRRNLEYSTQK